MLPIQPLDYLLMNFEQLSFPNPTKASFLAAFGYFLTIQEQIEQSGNIPALKLTVQCKYSYLPTEHIHLIKTDSFHEIHSKSQ